LRQSVTPTDQSALGIVIARLRQNLACGLPGVPAQQAMAPVPRTPRAPGVRREDLQPAAVLLLLYPCGGEVHLPLVLRSPTLRRHSGEVALPGGRQERGDSSLWDTALREAQEEIGIAPRMVSPVGALTPLEVPVSGYLVQPWVGVTQSRPRFHIEEREVAGLLELPASVLLDPSSHDVEQRELHGRPARVPVYRYEGTVIWGATAMILSEFEAILRRIP